jgi:hypothetical protein
MKLTRRTTQSNTDQRQTTARKLKDKSTYKIIVLGSGGVGKVRQ